MANRYRQNPSWTGFLAGATALQPHLNRTRNRYPNRFNRTANR
jgi:hypothetical protein